MKIALKYRNGIILLPDVRRCQHGAHANYYMTTAHRANKRVEEAQMSDEVRSFQLIQPYFAKLQSKMTGTLALMTRDILECRLLRTTFVMLKPMVTAAFRSCLPVMSLDACHMTNSFKGVLMSATMVDGGEHQTRQCLAWGTAPVENYEHWNWFAYLLRQGLAIDYTEQKQEEQEGEGGEERQEGDGGEGRKGDGEKAKNPRPTASANLTGASNLHRPRERACKGNQKPLPRLLPFLLCFPY